MPELRNLSPQKVIWQTKPGINTQFEKQFIEKVVLANVPVREVKYDGHYIVPCDDSIVIVSHNQKKPNQKLAEYLKKSKNVVLIHLSGENLYPSEWMYQYADVVFRSYFDPRVTNPNVFSLPLGFKTGFLNEDGDCFSSVKSLVWLFVGEIKSHRAEMLTYFNALKPNYTHLTKGWNADSGVSVEQMCINYRRARFALCPFGWINPDSFRIMESLENGAIPVSVTFRGGQDYFRYIYGNHPFLIASSWRQAADMINNEELVNGGNALLFDWYGNFKRCLSADVASIIGGERDPNNLLSKQFQMQAIGRRNFMLKIWYGWHFWCEPKLRAVIVKILRAFIGRS